MEKVIKILQERIDRTYDEYSQKKRGTKSREFFTNARELITDAYADAINIVQYNYKNPLVAELHVTTDFFENLHIKTFLVSSPDSAYKLAKEYITSNQQPNGFSMYTLYITETPINSCVEDPREVVNLDETGEPIFIPTVKEIREEYQELLENLGSCITLERLFELEDKGLITGVHIASDYGRIYGITNFKHFYWVEIDLDTKEIFFDVRYNCYPMLEISGTTIDDLEDDFEEVMDNMLDYLI